jgi:FKBP-type peptidyl-prolyl cis-trans isomerase
MKNQKGNISVIVSLIIVVIFAGVIIYVLMYKTKKLNSLENINTNQEQSTENTNIGESNNTSKDNMEKVSKNGLSAQAGDILVMNYTGRLTDGTVFDSNVDPKFSHVEPFEFTLGAGQVIKGWDEGLLGMKVGEKKTLTITPDKGYGDRAIGLIPANSTLIFDVELVAIK